jgi:hypothetical protein
MEVMNERMTVETIYKYHIPSMHTKNIIYHKKFYTKYHIIKRNVSYIRMRYNLILLSVLQLLVKFHVLNQHCLFL